MKKVFGIMPVILITLCLSAQPPQKMSYQAVVRNSSGALVTNHPVGMRISILQGSASGTVIYQEIYNPNPETNVNGLVTIEIGSGLPVTGAFSSINWASGQYFLKTETDPAGGTSYTIVGTSQLLSVPYALQAGTVSSYSESDPVFGASPSHGITSSNISNWNTAYGWGNHAGLYRPASWVPVWGDVTGKPSFATVATSGSYNDLSNKPTILNSQWTTNGSNIFYNTGNVGIGTWTTFPNATLDVNGTVQIGLSGKVFSEIFEITGTTATSDDRTFFSYPSGYTSTNMRVLSCEINYDGNSWVGIGGCASPITDIQKVYYFLGSSISLYYPPKPNFQNRAYRMLVMKVQ